MNSASMREMRQRVAAEKDAAAQAVPGVEEGVDGAEGEDGVEERSGGRGWRHRR